jgi:hypothetical protein
MTRRARVLLLAVLTALTAATLGAGSASADVVWLCKPGLTDDPCRPSLTTTRYASWNQDPRVVRPRRDRTPPIDCFYVYPTVSDQPATQATKAKDPEIRDIALYQAARYSQHCRVFAPVYRQITVRGLQRNDATEEQVRTAQADLVEAWRTYLRRHNRGRGVVIIGHSQGTLQLQELIRREVEPRRSVRRRLVSAILLGGNVTVRRGADRGGVFRRLRACRSPRQLGCVIAWVTFDETPPQDARFGRSAGRYADVFGWPKGDDLQVLCTNPAALRGGRAPLDLVLPTRPFAPGTLIGVGNSLLGITPPTPPTPWFEVPGAFTGRCATEDGASFLRVSPNDGTPDPRPAPDPGWGLHLLDANIALGDLVDVVRTQGRAYARRSR